MIVVEYIANFPEYIETVAEWFKLNWGYRYPDRTIEQWKEKVYCSKEKVPMTLIAINEGEQRCVGTVSLTKKGDDFFLDGLYVNKKDRHKGIGTVLINFIHEKSIDLDISNLKLFTYGDGHIYQQRGWEVIEKKQEAVPPVLMMTKKL